MLYECMFLPLTPPPPPPLKIPRGTCKKSTYKEGKKKDLQVIRPFSRMCIPISEPGEPPKLFKYSQDLVQVTMKVGLQSTSDEGKEYGGIYKIYIPKSKPQFVWTCIQTIAIFSLHLKPQSIVPFLFGILSLLLSSDGLISSMSMSLEQMLLEFFQSFCTCKQRNNP